MGRHPLRIVYETSPEKLEGLKKWVMAFATATRIREVRGRMYLEVDINEDIFQVGPIREPEMPSGKAHTSQATAAEGFV